jgi:hypothetical protein
MKWVLALIAACGVIVLASLPLPCELPKETGKTQEQRKHCPSTISTIFIPVGDFIHSNKDDVTAASTAIIALFTIIVGIFTIKLARFTKVSTEHTPRIERAYVTVTHEAPGLTFDDASKIMGLQGIEWVILRDHSGGSACG